MTGFFILCVCLFLDWFPLAVLGLIFFDYPRGLIYSTLLMIAAGIFAVSPPGERIGRAVLGCRPATTEERQRITGVWNSVVAAIGLALGSGAGERFTNVKLFVSEEKLPNAFALGRNTVCVTRGLLNLASPVDMAGVLAHEAGHLHFGDSGRLAVALTANRLGVASHRILDLCSRIFEGFARGVLQSGRVFAGSGGIAGVFIILMALLAVIVANVFNLAMRVVSFTFQMAADVSLRAVGRNEEFRADLFARNIGFGPQLAKFLRQIEALDAAPRDIWAVLYRTHPPTAERIERLLHDVS
ncbi:MAG: M48 family metalloprotease [Thermacetogeniaceae bacterium]|jgi:heat shock protein HtpX